jgi:hypothetical protein
MGAAYAATPDTSVQLPPEASTNWWTAVQQNIRESEYHVTWQEKTTLPDLQAAYQAPNRAHNLRTYFTDTGIHVIPRTSEIPEWEWGLQLTGYGYNGQIIPVAPAELKTSGNRIEYHRGDLIEWYVNDNRGLEQGFTLHSPPKKGVQSSLCNGIFDSVKSTRSVEADPGAQTSVCNEIFDFVNSTLRVDAKATLHSCQRCALLKVGAQTSVCNKIEDFVTSTLSVEAKPGVQRSLCNGIFDFVNSTRSVERTSGVQTSVCHGICDSVKSTRSVDAKATPDRSRGQALHSSTLTLELALTGSVLPKINADGTAIDFFAPPSKGGFRAGLLSSKIFVSVNNSVLLSSYE